MKVVAVPDSLDARTFDQLAGESLVGERLDQEVAEGVVADAGPEVDVGVETGEADGDVGGCAAGAFVERVDRRERAG